MLSYEREAQIRGYIADPERYGLPINWVKNTKELFDEIDRLREWPYSDMSKCQVVIEITLPQFGKAYAHGIAELKDGTLVNLGIKINIPLPDGTETGNE